MWASDFKDLYGIRLKGSFGWFPAAAKAGRSRDGTLGETIDFSLADRRASVSVFQKLAARPARRFMRAGMALAIHAKRKSGQAIENKQFWEIPHFAPPMISRAYEQRRETVRFARRKEAFRFRRLFRLVEAQNARERNQRRIRGARGGCSAAQRPGNGAASRWNCSKWTRR